MFTGIITDIGTIERVEQRGDLRVVVATAYDTAGDAALVWDARDPYLFAASVAKVRDDASLRRVLRERGLARVEREFSTAALERNLASLMERFA